MCSDSFGLDEERFHYRVALSTKETRAAEEHLKRGRLSGRVERGLPEGPDPAMRRRGLTLNLAEPALYVPLHVDGIADAGPYGLASVEIKSMTTGSFLRTLKGHVEYGYRVQMATPGGDLLHASGGPHAGDPGPLGVPPAPGPDPSAADWEAAEVCHPFEPRLLDEARGRVKRILLATPTQLPAREYGPSFACPTCEATGRQERTKGTREPLKRGPRPCGDCGATGTLSEAPLPWQCRYCAFVGICWPMAQLSFDEGERPVYTVKRDHVEGIAVQGVNP